MGRNRISSETMTENDKQTILTLAEHGGNIRETAEALFITVNAVHMRLNRIEERTGLNARVFFDLCRLYQRAGGELPYDNDQDQRAWEPEPKD